ncbi:VCBS repeat-containing protein [Candidatus Poribacteria bacterium]|nr:VCBS repeat-containing protein [Candidatus Poribacteria bacterium]
MKPFGKISSRKIESRKPARLEGWKIESRKPARLEGWGFSFCPILPFAHSSLLPFLPSFLSFPSSPSFLSRFTFHVSRFASPAFLLLFILISTAVADTTQSTITFVDVAAASGLDFEHTDGKSGVRLFNEFLGSGGGFFDYDNDGDLDIYLVNGAPQVPHPQPPLLKLEERGQGGEVPTNALYRNNGDGTFTNVTNEAGVGDTGYGAGCAVGDYDNDGNIDLYVANFGPNVLYRNNGDGTFTDVSVKAGVANGQWGTSCAFADVDNDGFLDLYIANYADYAIEKDKRCYVRGIWTYCGPRAYPPARDVFYHNNGNGTGSTAKGNRVLSTTGAESWFATDNVISTGKWIHVALTSSATAGMRAYVDGADVTSKTGQTAEASNKGPFGTFPGSPVEIGVGRRVGGTDGNDGYFNGGLDKIGIWNRTLSADEVKMLSAGQAPTAVETKGKLSTRWGKIKAAR